MARDVDVLRPFLEQGGPNDVGEWGMFCPLHDDNKRSASANFEKGTWYCHACDKGGRIRELAKHVAENNLRRNGAEVEGAVKVGKGTEPLPSQGTIAGWVAALQDDAIRLREFEKRRGINADTLAQFNIGWDSFRSAYTIPVYDADDNLVNVRFYQLDPSDDRRKIWGLRGRGEPVLYPINQLADNPSHIIVCEGEWDALVTIQHGFVAVTRTGAADVWKGKWNDHFADRRVYLCHDMDQKGKRANAKVAREVARVAASVHIVELPYEFDEKHGKDLTDFWLDNPKGEDEFEELVLGTPPYEGAGKDPETLEVEDVRLLDTFAADRLGQPIRVRVTITGHRVETYGVPEQVHYRCTMNAGVKCGVCSMNPEGFNGDHEEYIPRTDYSILEMMGAPNATVAEILRKRIRAAKNCGLLEINPVEHHTVAEIYVRPDVDRQRLSHEEGDLRHRKVVSVGNHTTSPNSTVEIVGTTFAHPRDQVNTLQAWEVNKIETSIDNYDISPEMFEQLKVFKAGLKGPYEKIKKIANEMAQHVTHIYGRPEMHMLMDLTFHSVLGFEFEGRMDRTKGWLDVLIIGDTRTGKSEAAARLIDHYGVGEMVSCESSSFAGVVGGLEQYAGKEWMVRWGVIPIHDRRLVVLDEISGLSYQEIGNMSAIRSSGYAELTKIRSERAWARTRLLWMGNPRKKRMSDYTYGVQAIRPLVGNTEDVARFDLAMSVASGDVSSEEINRDHDEDRNNPYTAELCNALVLWAWSRKPYQVYWQVGAQDLIRDYAKDLGEAYIDNPPLIQVENVRLKIARVAAAIAARTFSTDDGVHLDVTAAHVDAAVKFINDLYSMNGFGYKEISEDAIEEKRKLEADIIATRKYLTEHPPLAKFLRRVEDGFKLQDLMDALNQTREGSSGITAELFGRGMLGNNDSVWKINPPLHALLREVRRDEYQSESEA